MEEVKSPKKTLIYYYVIVLLAILLFNIVLTPMLRQGQVVEVDYGTFMDMTDENNIGTVQMDDNQILFTNRDNTMVFKTGVMNDPSLIERLHNSGAVFSKVITEPMSPLMSLFLNFVLPLLIFFAIGQYFSRKLMQSAGGKNSMMFGMGKSNAKVYVQSTAAYIFQMSLARTRRRRVLPRLWIICIIPRNIRTPAHLCLRVFFSWVLPEPERRCLQRQLPENPVSRSSQSAARSSLRCS